MKKRSRRRGRKAARQNPFNATRPAEWNTMSKSLRKAWNRRHWRPEVWKAELALKKEATRLAHRREKGARWSELAEGALETAVDLVRAIPGAGTPSTIGARRARGSATPAAPRAVVVAAVPTPSS